MPAAWLIVPSIDLPWPRPPPAAAACLHAAAAR
jgi:hypothetical protein